MKTRVLSVMIVLAAFWTAMPMRGTTLVRMSLSQLSQASNTIVLGHVASQESRWNRARTRIMTYTTVTLDQALKGQPPATLTVEQPGGTVGNFHVRVPGTALFRPQAQYVLFLQSANARPGMYRVVGMVQGAFRVFRGGSPLERRVILPLGGLSTGMQSQMLGQAAPLGEFNAQISKAVAAPVVLPHGMSIPAKIESTQFLGAGRLEVVARTTTDSFPNASVVVPAGSLVTGTAIRTANGWEVHWTSISVRGVRTKISGIAEEPAGVSLPGQLTTIQVR